jgi:hypothetical protein
MYCDEADYYYSVMDIDLKDIEVIETGDEFDTPFDCYEMVVYSSYGTTDFSAKNDSFAIVLSIKTVNIEETTYQQEQLDMDYCRLTDLRDGSPKSVVFESISLDVVFDGDTIFLYGDGALGKDGNRYNIVVKYYIPSPQGTVDLGELNGGVLDYTKSYSAFYLYGFNADSTDYLQLYIKSADLIGNFAKADVVTTQGEEGYYSFLQRISSVPDTTLVAPFYNANITIVRDQPTVAKATISVLGKDLIQYNAVIYFEIDHEPTGNTQTIDITEIPNVAYGEYEDYYEIMGYQIPYMQKYFIVSGVDANYATSFMVLKDTVPAIDTAFVKASDFSISSGGYKVSYLYDIANDKRLNVGDSVSLTVSHVADTTFFKFTFLCREDGDIYDVNLKYYIPEATDTVRFVADLGKSVDFIYSAGEAFIQAKKSAPADSIYLVSLYFSGINDLYGTFTVNDLYQEDYSIAHVDGTDTTKVVFLTADIKITSVDATTAHAAIYAQGRDNVIYDFSFDFTVRDNFGDDSENALNLTFAHDQFMLSSTTPYDTIYAYDGTYMLSARFLTNAATLANGTYTIDDVLDYNHISASHGSVLFYDKTYGTYTDLTGAFVVKNLNSSTYAYEEVWYLVSGTATVTDTQIVIEAVNSKGNQVNITINRQEETALEELLLNGAAPRKLIDNGRVVIIRDGKAFGIDGRRIR